MNQPAPVIKKILSNGLIVLIHPVTTLPRVSINLWYGVGSKHEKSNEKGLAHLIEHMIFKGTDKLSETDIDETTTKLSGFTNAFTSYDYTCYVFDFPSNAWKSAFFLLADCMQHCRFQQQMLNSELSAVIQELKLYKDDYFDTLLSRMSASIFYDHPYHYPIIGFKQDLWNATRENLLAFYKKHYVPNNAVLVVVGNVDPQEVIEEAEKQFGHIPKDETYQKQEFYLSSDLVNQSVVLYRDIVQPQAAVTFVLPGVVKNKTNRFLYEMLACVLGKGKSSRLYAKIVDDLQLASELHCAIDQRQDATLLDITFQPNTAEDIPVIINLIQDEIQNIIDQGVTQKELTRAFKQVKVSLLSVLESYADQAALIGESFLLTGDENLIFKELALQEVPADYSVFMQDLLKKYCSFMRRHEGKMLPMHDAMVEQWLDLQELSDQEDQRVLQGKMRTTEIEKPLYAHTLHAPENIDFTFAKPKKNKLFNGATVLTLENPTIEKIDIILTVPVKEYADPEDKQGLYRFLCDLMLEGTHTYPGTAFAQEVEGHGMTISCQPGVISLTVLKEDFAKGLEFLKELLLNVQMSDNDIEKVRSHILADLSVYWDDPQEFCHQLARQSVYKKHPYGKDPQGTVAAIKKITKDDLQKFYAYAFCSEGAHIAIIGDVRGYDVFKEVEKALSSWNRPFVKNNALVPLTDLVAQEITYEIHRDQVVLLFAGHSITRLDPDYEKLLLFDQIFGGGSSGSMSSRLMRIREQTGLFYGIGGSLIVGCDEQNGMVLIRTTVSLDRLKEAKDLLLDTIKNVVDSLTEKELQQAKKTVISGLIDNFNSNKKIAGAYLGVARFNLPDDYFDTLADRISGITLSEVQEAAGKILVPEKMVTLLIGRVKN